MASHTLTLDEVTGDPTDYHAQAYCSCGWSEDRWHHADQYAGGADEAQAAAVEAGQDHRADAE